MDDNQLFLADIGDNRARRDFITVFAIDDPEPNDDTRTYRAYDFAYPDRPRDTEAMLVNSRGRFFFVTKEARAGIYRAPANPLPPERQPTDPGRRCAGVRHRRHLHPPTATAWRSALTSRWRWLDAESFEEVGPGAAPAPAAGRVHHDGPRRRGLLVGSEVLQVEGVPHPGTHLDE